MKLRLLIGSIAAAAAVSAQTSNVPIDNTQVKVLLVDVQPHVKTKLHEHTVNRVMVYLQAGKQDFNYQGGKKSELSWKAGEAKWSPAAGMHVAEIVSDNPVTIAEIELKKTGVKGTSASAPLDPAKVDPKHYHIEFENDQVRVLRVRIPPHQSTPVHTHVLNRVIVYLTDQNIQVTTTDGKSDRLHHKQGEVSWGGPATHKEENMSDHLFEVIAVEIKN
jgi:quercetin dioxygenase-like cupin family protein